MSHRLKIALLCGLVMLAGHADAAAPWSYDGDKDYQDNWGILSPAYTVCETGVSQSPVQIAETKIQTLPKLDLRYSNTTGHIHMADHAIRIDVDGKQTLRDGDKTYHLRYITFHAPSEHVIKDRFYTMEIEFFHQDKAGEMLILSAFVQEGAPNDVLTLMQNPQQKELNKEMRFNPASLLPKSRSYYAYTGSLTIPPCTEGVAWRVLKQPAEATLDQLALLVKHMPRNARVPQPVYMRRIFESKE